MIMLMNKKSFTLVEVVGTIVISTFLIAVVLNVFILSTQMYYIGICEQRLQYKVNALLNKIIEGKPEPGGVFRLSEAVSYNLVSIDELHFTGTDNIERWFRLDNNSKSVIYHHPTSSGGADEIIYTAPEGTTVTLRFSTPVGSEYMGVVLGVDVALTSNVSGRTISGSASTYVNIRNHAV